MGPVQSKSPSHSNSCITSSRSKGATWDYVMKYLPAASLSSFKKLSSDTQLQMLEFDTWFQQKIEKIHLYKTPLSEHQWTNLIFNHQYLIIQTKSWWWSIEKNACEILIQRNKQLSKVRDENEEEARVKSKYWKKWMKYPLKLESDRGVGNIKELFYYMVQNEVKKKYDVTNSNCKHFAKRIFDKFAKNKYYSY